MADTKVRATISKNSERICEIVTGNAKDNDLKELIVTLKETQRKVNDFLTTLVDEEQNDLTKDDYDDLESGSDEDSTEERNTVNPKKYQLRYVVEWFQEWSEMQRADFLEILAERCGPPSTVNGLASLVDSLSCKEESNRPPSLFQCRVKLFHEWSQNWSQQEKEGLVVSIKNMDPKFAEKYDQREVLPVENELSLECK